MLSPDHDLSIWAHVVLPILIALLVFILIILLVIFCNRRKRQQHLALNTEKEVISNERNPIIFPDEIASDDPGLQSKSPIVLPSDSKSVSSHSSYRSPVTTPNSLQPEPKISNLQRENNMARVHDAWNERTWQPPEPPRRHSNTCRKLKDRHSTVSAVSGLSYERPNNHYLEEDEAPCTPSGTLRKSKALEKRPPRHPPPYWPAQADPPPYRLPPPYLTDPETNTTQV